MTKKLSLEEKVEIKVCLKKGMKQLKVAKEYEIYPSTITRLKVKQKKQEFVRRRLDQAGPIFIKMMIYNFWKKILKT